MVYFGLGYVLRTIVVDVVRTSEPSEVCENPGHVHGYDRTRDNPDGDSR